MSLSTLSFVSLSKDGRELEKIKNLIKNNLRYYKIIQIIAWEGKSKSSDWFFLGQDFAIQTVFINTVIMVCIFALVVSVV